MEQPRESSGLGADATLTGAFVSQGTFSAAPSPNRGRGRKKIATPKSGVSDSAPSFAEATAKATGESVSAIYQDVARGNAIPEAEKVKVVGTSRLEIVNQKYGRWSPLTRFAPERRRLPAVLMRP